MTMSGPIINLDEEFPFLPNAPIVEAVIDIRSVSKTPWDEKQVGDELKKSLSGYPKVEAIRESELQFSVGKTEDPLVKDRCCVGFKLYSADNRYVVRFQKSQFIFSRLKPYENWQRFTREALDLWQRYVELLQPVEIRRMGVRFINRIALPDDKIDLGDYYKAPPQTLKGDVDWPLAGFLHQDILQVPGTSYIVSLRKTIQSSGGKTGKETGLILDIDVYMQSPFEYTEKEILKYWEEMRWVKNTVFFNSLTEKTIEVFK